MVAGIDAPAAAAIAEAVVWKLPAVFSASWQLVGSELGRLLLAFLVGVFFWAIIDVFCLLRASCSEFVQAIAYTLRAGVSAPRAALSLSLSL